MANNIKVFIAGGTGWAGSVLSKAVAKHPDMELVGALSRTYHGQNLADVLGLERSTVIPIYDNIKEALEAVDFDVLVEYTAPEMALHHVVACLQNGKNVVIGTSGLTEENYIEIERIAEEENRSVLAVGNFSLTVVLLQKFAEMAVKHIPNYEIIDYASDGKKDAPSGTARELAHRLSRIQASTSKISDDFVGPPESRGIRLQGAQVHSIRLPGYVIGIDALFGLKDEKLILRHEAGASADPYVKGALLAIEKVSSFTGLRRGLDTVMDF